MKERHISLRVITHAQSESSEPKARGASLNGRFEPLNPITRIDPYRPKADFGGHSLSL